MTFRTYPDVDQAHLTHLIRAAATKHEATSLYLWRTALELVNPEVVTVAPYCMMSTLDTVYDLLDVATIS